MTCETFNVPGGTAIVCTRGQRDRKKCGAAGCTKKATILCDYPVGTTKSGKAKTCDRPLCRSHAISQPTPDTDYCGAHALTVRR